MKSDVLGVAWVEKGDTVIKDSVTFFGKGNAMARRLRLRDVAIIAAVLAAAAVTGWLGRWMLRPTPPDELGIAGCTDTVEVARQAGYDYVKLTYACLAGKPDAMHRFFVMTVTARFDAASAEGHASVLGTLLERLGDRFFGECLAREPAAVQEEVRRELLYDLGWEADAVAMEDVERRYPVTFPTDRRDRWQALRDADVDGRD